MERVTVRKRRSQWHVAVDGEFVADCPTRQEALGEARRRARQAAAPPPIEFRGEHGGWRTIAP